MEGSIHVESEAGKGTTFSFELPFLTADETTIKAKDESTISDADVDILNKSRILLAEDNEFNTLLARDTLHSIAPHIQITEAATGFEVLDLLQNNAFDLVLMDIQMPKMDGMEATRIIRNEFETPVNETRIIAMTANVMKEDIARYLAVGMNDHIPKPFQKEELFRKLLKHLDKESIAKRDSTFAGIADESAIETTENQLPEQATDLPHGMKYTDPAFLISFAGNNIEKQKKYISLFLDNAPKLVTQLEMGIKQKDYNSVRLAAHSLKTQLNYMGVKEEYSHVYELEQLASFPARHADMESLIVKLKVVCEKAFAELGAFVEQ